MGTDNQIELVLESDCWEVDSLRSWRDFARENFCFGSEAVKESGEAVRGLVKSPVEFPLAQIRGVF